MAEPVRARRVMIIMASASGTLVPAIARLVAADEDTVRDVIHLFNQEGLAALDPQWAGGRPRLISDEDIQVIVTAATTRPEKLGQPFTRWSLRKLTAYLADRDHPVRIGRERLRQILQARGISFQRTRTWKESRDPGRDAKLDRIEYVTSAYPDRCFAFDQFGPLSPLPSVAGPGGRTSSCASRRRTHHGLIRSRRISVPCGPSSWATPTIRTTPRWPASCRPTCAGATRTRATPTSWPPSAVSAPASAANASNAGAAPSLKRRD
jgi:transposase